MESVGGEARERGVGGHMHTESVVGPTKVDVGNVHERGGAATLEALGRGEREHPKGKGGPPSSWGAVGVGRTRWEAAKGARRLG